MQHAGLASASALQKKAVAAGNRPLLDKFVAVLCAEGGYVDHSQWIRRFDPQLAARPHAGQTLPGFENRQRAIQSLEVVDLVTCGRAVSCQRY